MPDGARPGTRRTGPSPAAGYSGTPLAKKLGIRSADVVALLGAPRGWTVPDLPEGARVRRTNPSGAHVVIAFVRRASELADTVARVVDDLAPDSALWLCWPRRAGGHDSDVTEHRLRAVALPTGLVDVKVAAVGDDWSGLRFVWRKTARAARR